MQNDFSYGIVEQVRKNVVALLTIFLIFLLVILGFLKFNYPKQQSTQTQDIASFSPLPPDTNVSQSYLVIVQDDGKQVKAKATEILKRALTSLCDNGYLRVDSQRLVCEDLNVNFDQEALLLNIDGTSLDFSSLRDNTDNQRLVLTGNTLQITGGNQVVFEGWDTNIEDDVKTFKDLNDTPKDYGPLGQLLVSTGSSISYIDPLDLDVGYLTRDSTGTLYFRTLGDDLVLRNNEQIRFETYTPGGIFFVGSNGELTYDVTKLYFDYSNIRLGVGTNAPNSAVDVKALDFGDYTKLLGLRFVTDTFYRFTVKSLDSAKPIGIEFGSGTKDPAEITFALDTSSTLIPIRLRMWANYGDKTILELNAPYTDPKEATLTLTRNGIGYNEIVDLYNQAYTGQELWGLNYIKDGASASFKPFMISFQDGLTAPKQPLIYISTTGDVGIGTDTPSYKLDVAGKIRSTGTLRVDGSQINIGGTWAQIQALSSFLDIKTAGGDYISFTQGATEVMRITGGKVGIGTDTPTYLLQVGVSGDGSAAIANSWLTFSDVRYKENVSTIKNALAKLRQIRGVSFVWKRSKRKDLGFIAQEVKRVFPELVRVSGDGMLSLDYKGIAPVLVEAVKELDGRVSKLEQKTKLNNASDTPIVGKVTLPQGSTFVEVPLEGVTEESVVSVTLLGDNPLPFSVKVKNGGFVIIIKTPSDAPLEFSYVVY